MAEIEERNLNEHLIESKSPPVLQFDIDTSDQKRYPAEELKIPQIPSSEDYSSASKIKDFNRANALREDGETGLITSASFSVDSSSEFDDFENQNPFSSQYRIIIPFNFQKRKYVLDRKDNERLQMKNCLPLIKSTLNQINNDRNLRPPDFMVSCCKQVFFKAFIVFTALVLCLLFFYLAFVFLFNPVIIGILVWSVVFVVRRLRVLKLRIMIKWR
jgi:hypothetical protein